MRQLRELPRAPQRPPTSCQTTGAAAGPPGNQTSVYSSHTQDEGDNGTQNNTPPALDAAEQQQQLGEQLGEAAFSDETTPDEAHIKVVSENEGAGSQTGEDVDTEGRISTGAKQDNERKEPHAAAAASDPHTKQAPSLSQVEQFLFKCLLNVIPEDDNLQVEMHWVEGHNKDLMNQLCTYLKNILLKSVTKS